MFGLFKKKVLTVFLDHDGVFFIFNKRVDKISLPIEAFEDSEVKNELLFDQIINEKIKSIGKVGELNLVLSDSYCFKTNDPSKIPANPADLVKYQDYYCGSSVTTRLKILINPKQINYYPISLFNVKQVDVNLLENIKKNKANGFTLIELLVVMGVLTFLLALVLVAVNPSQQLMTARNLQRSGDVNVILNAVDQYLIKTGNLPAGITNSPQTIKSGTGGVNICSLLVTEYVAALPHDPQNGSYVDCTSYDTGYTIAKSTNDRVTVSAPNAENGANISVTR